MSPFLPLYLTSFAVLVGGGLAVGFILKWWGLLASVGFASFFVYAWDFEPEGIAYAVIAGITASGAVIAGNLLRQSRLQ